MTLIGRSGWSRGLNERCVTVRCEVGVGLGVDSFTDRFLAPRECSGAIEGGGIPR